MRDQDTSAPSISFPEAFAIACKMDGPLKVRAVHRLTGSEQTFTIDQPFAFIGRAPTMDVALDDPSVSQCHAYLQIVEGAVYCIDLGSRTGVAWPDGSHVRGWVPPGQVLRLGTFDLSFGNTVPAAGALTPARPEPEEGEAAGNHAPAPAVLEVHNSTSTRTVAYPLEHPLTLIGRHPHCQLRLLDHSIGYFHCILVGTPDGVWFFDFLSRKGTRLNGRPARLCRLRDGDLLELGKVTLLLRAEPGPGRPEVLGEAVVRPTPEAPLATPHQVGEAAAQAFAPFREMMDQFQQSFMTMARMVTAMQHEHAAMMFEQMRHVQELTKELQALRDKAKADLAGGTGSPGPSGSPAATPPGDQPGHPPAPRPPAQRGAGGGDNQALDDAHSWFLEQIAKRGQ